MDGLTLILPLVAAVAVPLVGALLIALTPGRLAEFWSYLAAAVTLACVALVARPVLNGAAPAITLVELLPGLPLALRVDALGLTFGLLSSALWLVATLYSSGYVRGNRHMKNRTRYFAFFAASVGAALGIAFSANLLTFLIFYETLTLGTYPLVAHKETHEALAGARRYLVFALSAGLVLTAAVAWTWMLTGTLHFVPGGFLGGQPARMLAPLFLLFIVGVGVKAAVMPLHSWLPAAMVAPTPVSALLHAVAVVKAGVFGVIRVMGYVFGPEAFADFSGNRILLGFSAATIVLGSLIALRQDNLKRRLAFSTVVHLNYIVLGAALMTPLGITGAVLHLVNHGLSKITLFFCAGAVYTAKHREDISDMGGLGRQMPWTFTMFAIASLSLAGVPGLCGFISKFYLARGAAQGDDWLYLAALLGAGLLTASYLLPVVGVAFFGKPTDHGGEHDAHHDERPGEALPAIVVALVTTGLLVIVFGLSSFAIGAQFSLADAVARSVFGGMP